MKAHSQYRKSYHMLKYSALSRGYKWQITLDEYVAITSNTCHYCGEAAKPQHKSYARPGVSGGWQWVGMLGLDRVDNRRGYTTDNVVSCCKTCNTMKGTKSYESFMRQVETIVYTSRARELL